jgi:GGDEF domain-containing protein
LKALWAEGRRRVGGDEFIVILGMLPDREVAARVAERTIAAISAPIDCAVLGLGGASIGIALFPDHADDANA